MSSLDQLTERLRALSAEIDAETDVERAADLVAEASKLAAEAGEEAERAMREASSPPAPGPAGSQPE